RPSACMTPNIVLFSQLSPPHPTSSLFPYTTLFRSVFPSRSWRGRTHACAACWMMKESHDDALHDGRPVGARGPGRVRVGAAARGGMRGVPGRARGTVPARRTAEGAAGAPTGAGPLARGAGRRVG